MLKIKDNVDLKELEKFGFVPRYSEETGELVEMRRFKEMSRVEKQRCEYY